MPCEQCGSVKQVELYWWIEQKNEKWLLCSECGVKEDQTKCS